MSLKYHVYMTPINESSKQAITQSTNQPLKMLIIRWQSCFSFDFLTSLCNNTTEIRERGRITVIDQSVSMNQPTIYNESINLLCKWQLLYRSIDILIFDGYASWWLVEFLERLHRSSSNARHTIMIDQPINPSANPSLHPLFITTSQSINRLLRLEVFEPKTLPGRYLASNFASYHIDFLKSLYYVNDIKKRWVTQRSIIPRSPYQWIHQSINQFLINQ